MPIKDRSRYPKNWKAISDYIRFDRAGGKCEGSPLFPECRAEHGKPHPETGSNVVLTVAHLDHQPEHCEETNLRAMCQRCHLNHDKHFHVKNRRLKKSILNYFSQQRLFEWRIEDD